MPAWHGFSIGSASVFPPVEPRSIAAAWLDRVPDATEREIETAAYALYDHGFTAEACIMAWRVIEYERRTGRPF